MYQVGEKIFYPMHGAGIIEAIEEKEMFGEKQFYYIMNLSLGKMHVMIPTTKTKNLGIRHLVDTNIMEDVLNSFKGQEETEATGHPNQRYRINMEKIKSGDIFEGAEVIRDLNLISKRKSLGTGDKTLLNNARQILISELVLVHGIGKDEATDVLKNAMNA